jgi:hypothetical protein
MIVRQEEGCLHLITQPDHAALAGLLMSEWEPLRQAARRPSILLAIGEHDNGWQDLDEAPRVDPASGRIFDFVTVPAAERQAVWHRGIVRLAERDRWAAALVAHHAVFVYDRYRRDGAWAGFFASLEKTRGELVAASGRTLDELLADYPYLRLGDLISLTFCNRVGGPQSYERWSLALVGEEMERVAVTPDGLAGREVPLAVTAREVPDVVYRTDDELRSAVRGAPRITLRGVLSSRPGPPRERFRAVA